MEFTKMHGAGNDFIMINDMDETLDISAELVSVLCARRFGIGADGVVILRPSRIKNFTMIYYNSDGSRAGMCGNGARCAVRFAVNEGIASGRISFESDSGLMEGRVRGESIEISMGEVRGLKLNMEVEGERVSYAVAGVPHAAIFEEGGGSSLQDDFVEVARKIRYSERFKPEGANVNLVYGIGSGSLSYRTYERGVEAETMACGTGALAISVLAGHLGIAGESVECRTYGGDILKVNYRKEHYGASNCFLTGPAIETFRGSVDIAEFNK
ncbi:MAG: diaminopimelate epimerase [Candidatus Krumholzibacteriota bacterium]